MISLMQHIFTVTVLGNAQSHTVIPLALTEPIKLFITFFLNIILPNGFEKHAFQCCLFDKGVAEHGCQTKGRGEVWRQAEKKIGTLAI